MDTKVGITNPQKDYKKPAESHVSSVELYLPWSHTKSGSSDSPAAKGEAVPPPPQAGGWCPRITSSPVSTRMRRRPGQCHFIKVHPPLHLYSQGVRKHSYTPHKWPMGVIFKTCKTYIFQWK